ncbi:MAG: hypothetical protein HYT73_03375 [Candidatus Aenigmarchaeota archaeon]|nr:hypothetical protein [Candidatus Aenigmarchaeota archaeon]
MVPLGKIFSRAWKYSLEWKRITPFFLLLVPFVMLFAAFAEPALNFLSQYGMLSAAGTIPLDIAVSLTSFFALFAFLIVAVFLIDLYVRGVIIDNAKAFYGGKRLSLKSSRKAFRGRYLSLLGAIIIVKLISTGLSVIPFVGWIFTIVLTWVFLVVLQSVVVSRKNTIDSIKDSYNLFISRKLDTVVFWLLLAIISFALFIAAMIPLLIAAWPVIAAVLSNLTGGTGVSVVDMIRLNLSQIFAAGLVSAFILGFAQLFKESATTFFYIEARKRKR